MPRKPKDIPSAEEILAMEISEDKRLRELGIDPDGDPLDIMAAVRKRAWAAEARERRQKEKAKSVSGGAVNPYSARLPGRQC